MIISPELVQTVKAQLYTAVVSDVLDSLGFPEQALAPHVRPLDESLVLFGRARTGLYMEMHYVEEGTNPYELEISLVDSLEPGDVVVFACQSSPRVAPWGELLSTTARARGAAGCVMDGLVRDVRFIREMGFPVFAGGIGPLDSKGRAMVMRIEVPVQCAGVRVCPGDYLLGDVDGVVVIPQSVALEAIEKALAKVATEDTVRAELERGDKLADVFARHQIL